MNTIYNTLIQWIEPLGISEGIMTWLIRLAAILMSFVVAFVIDRICRKLIIPIVSRITSRTETIWDDHLLSNDVLNALCGLILPITLCVMVPYVFANDPETYRFMMKVCAIYITIKSINLVCTVITSLHTISTKHEKFKGQSLKGFYQMLKLITVCIGVIIIISTLIDKNPLAILTGLGAGTAILMLVFQDTIKGLVAGIQLMANEMLSPGDWITVPKYGADGDVIEWTYTLTQGK